MQCLFFVCICFISWSPTSALYKMGIGQLTYGQITTAIYLKISISDFLTLFSARTGGDWFWHTMPAPGIGNILFACIYKDDLT